MAAIVRVKRRREEDPADSLLLSCKRVKKTTTSTRQTNEQSPDEKSYFRFAGTVSEKVRHFISYIIAHK